MVPFNLECYTVNVYVPQDRMGMQELWTYIYSSIWKRGGNYIIFGDFNVVRSQDERFGSSFFMHQLKLSIILLMTMGWLMLL